MRTSEDLGRALANIDAGMTTCFARGRYNTVYDDADVVEKSA